MRLAIPSLCLFLYVILSFVLPLPCRRLGRVAAAFAVLAVCLKYLAYEIFGGSFFAPELPRPLLLTQEALYASAVILFFLLLMKDGLAGLLWLGRRAGFAWRHPFSPPVRIAGLLATGCPPADLSLEAGFSPAVKSAGLLAIALSLGCWSTWQAVKVPGIRTMEISVPGLPAQLDGFSVVQITDIHIGSLLRGEWLRAVVEKTNALHPDMVALTGDLIDGLPETIGSEVQPLGDLRAKHGVYGVTGNHEYYCQVELWLPVFKKLGIDMLLNEHRVLSVQGRELVIAGITDPMASRFGQEGPDVRKALNGAPDTTSILLAHQPRGATANTAADIQLSGHTHGGHMVFIQPLIASFNDGFVHGLYDVNGMKLHVSPGTGLWGGFSSRVGVPSEITRIVLRPQSTE